MVRCFKCGNSPGSPPPMRGKVAQFYFSQIVYRITPAYAGKSFRHLSSATIQQDHPRLCGEKLNSAFAVLIVLGSPPPMRGKVSDSVAGQCSVEDHPRLCGEKPFLQDIFPPVPGSPPPMRGKVHMCIVPSAALGITPAYAGKRYWFDS